MSKFSTFLTGAMLAVVAALPASATDFSDGNIHKNDYKWLQFNVMRSEDAKLPFGNQNDTYLEMEFGGRSGIVDMYGYVDWFDLLDSRTDQRHNSDNMFTKLAPRFSLDAMFHKDLSFGPVQELYISTVTNIGDSALWEHYVGLGSDVKVPWFGKMGLNTYARYVRENYGANNEHKFDGYMVSTNWFKPFVFFNNKSFIAYQGYLDYKFGANKLKNDAADQASFSKHSDHSLEWFNGFYWHNDRYALGYGLKIFNNMAFVQNGTPVPFLLKGKQETSGVGHYFSATYKF
jgi:nucleoside-specific channel-forming protein